jgi:hypothetical protein
MGFSPSIWLIIQDFIIERKGDIYLSDHPRRSRVLDLTLEVFNFVPGQKLSPVGELNEFLSALVMNEQLSPFLSAKDLLKLSLCVEATIPFRGRTLGGLSHFDVLERRLRRICKHRSIPLNDLEAAEAIKLAVIFANKDIESFGERNPENFLGNTWKLLPEMNVALRARDVYSIHEYRKALWGMAAFLSGLNPDNVFSQYLDEPPDELFQTMVAYAHQNVLVAREYLRLKLLGAAILEAFSSITGWIVPAALLIEDSIASAHLLPDPWLRPLPEPSLPEWADTGSCIFHLLNAQAKVSLASQRRIEWELFLYKSIPPDRVEYLLAYGAQMFGGDLSARAFLTHVGSALTSALEQASGKPLPA